MKISQFNEKYGKRNSSVELLRLAAMFGIVIIHAFGHGSGLDYEWIYSLSEHPETFGHSVLISLGEAGVTIFMFISGWYGIRVSARKVITMITMLMFYVILTSLFAGSSIKGISLSLLHPWDGWWFVQSYIIVWILSPFIEAGIEKLTEKQMRIVVLCLMFYTYIGHFLVFKMDQNTDLLLTIYVVARYLKIYPPHFLYKTRLGYACLQSC